jgi:hypothetical protein
MGDGVGNGKFSRDFFEKKIFAKFGRVQIVAEASALKVGLSSQRGISVA